MSVLDFFLTLDCSDWTQLFFKQRLQHIILKAWWEQTLCKSWWELNTFDFLLLCFTLLPQKIFYSKKREPVVCWICQPGLLSRVIPFRHCALKARKQYLPSKAFHRLPACYRGGLPEDFQRVSHVPAVTIIWWQDAVEAEWRRRREKEGHVEIIEPLLCVVCCGPHWAKPFVMLMFSAFCSKYWWRVWVCVLGWVCVCLWEKERVEEEDKNDW